MQKIKHIFIPHRHNSYRPHAIRSKGLIVFALYILTFQTIYNSHQAGQFSVLGYATNVSSGALFSATNSNRASNGLGALASSVKLNQAAQAKANHMIANNYWAHYAPDGTSPWFFIDQAGYTYNRAGENLAFGYSTSAGVVQGWMDSPGHRANILDSSFAHVGFGIANGANFQGGENTVVVAMYAEPFATAPVPSAPAPAPPTPAPAPVLSQAAPEPTPASEPVIEEDEPPKPAEDEAEEEDTNEEESEESGDLQDINSQRLLARLAEGGGVVVTGEAASVERGDERVSNFGALVNGQAHWSLYMVVGGMMSMAMVYFLRHLQAFGQIMVHGEHFVVGHPTLEASIIYLVLWLMLFATYGVIQ